MANSHHWAVVVGINQYPEFGRLRCAQRDAESFRDWLLDSEGGAIPAENVSTISVNLPVNCMANDAQPTMNQILDAVESAFIQAKASVSSDPSVWDDTRLYLYFSGHGISRDSVDSALLSADATPARLGRHVSCKALQDFFLGNRIFRELVIFADCCRDDARGKVASSFLPWTIQGQLGGNSTRLMLAHAAEFGQKSYEEQSGLEGERRGYFTRCLLETLNNRSSGNITLTGDFLRKRMKGLLANLANQPGAPEAGLKFEAVCIDEDEIEFGVTSKTPLYRARFICSNHLTHVRLLNGSGHHFDATRDAPNSFTAFTPMGLHEVELSNDAGMTYQRRQDAVMVVPGYNEWSLS